MTASITEQTNPLTTGLDVADPVGIVRMLRQSDAQIFSGFEGWPALRDEEVLEALARFAWHLSHLLPKADARVIMGGAGTSGRLATMASTEFNRILREAKLPEVFVPIIAGGEAALAMSQESAEDNGTTAVKDLKAAIPADLRKGMYIGISAGLSAPSVAAQLDFIGGDTRFQSVLIGFNPAKQARPTTVEGTDQTFLGILERAFNSDRFHLINPVYGPEAITGSTRLKGATTTKIILETVFITALEILRKDVPLEDKEELSDDNLFPLRALILRRLRQYETAISAVYESTQALGALVRLAGTSLRSAGRMYFIGRGSAGLLGIFDCAECPPTFGADPFDVRGFVLEGWELLGISSAAMKGRGKAYEIGHEKFEADYLPDLSRGDMVMGVAIQNLGESTRRLLKESHAAKASTALLLVLERGAVPTNIPDHLREFCLVEIPELGFLPGCNNLAEMALKLALNIVSTGAHAMSGKVYGNRLIDLRISNSKLYHRAVALIGELAGVGPEEANKALLHAIFKEPPKEWEEDGDHSVAVAVQRAAGRSRVVPMAVLLATDRFAYDGASERLSSEPRIRRIIAEELFGATESSEATRRLTPPPE